MLIRCQKKPCGEDLKSLHQNNRFIEYRPSKIRLLQSYEVVWIHWCEPNYVVWWIWLKLFKMTPMRWVIYITFWYSLNHATFHEVAFFTPYNAALYLQNDPDFENSLMTLAQNVQNDAHGFDQDNPLMKPIPAEFPKLHKNLHERIMLLRLLCHRYTSFGLQHICSRVTRSFPWTLTSYPTL